MYDTLGGPRRKEEGETVHGKKEIKVDPKQERGGKGMECGGPFFWKARWGGSLTRGRETAYMRGGGSCYFHGDWGRDSGKGGFCKKKGGVGMGHDAGGKRMGDIGGMGGNHRWGISLTRETGGEMKEFSSKRKRVRARCSWPAGLGAGKNGQQGRPSDGW